MICRCEVQYVWAKQRISAFTSSIWVIAHRILSYALVVAYVLIGGTLRASPLFIGLSGMYILAYIGIGCVFEGVTNFVDLRVTAVRVQVSMACYAEYCC